MKISKSILTLLITVSLFAFSVNKASAFSYETEQSKNNDNNKHGGDDGGCVSLPINGQAWCLLVAGLGIGSYIVLKKSKQTELKTAQINR